MPDGDQFVGPIATILTGLGYSVSTQSVPERDEWNNLPLTILCPSGKNKYYCIYFGIRNVQSSYEIYYVSENSLDNTLDPNHDQFMKDCMSNFMPIPATLGESGAGAWQMTAAPEYDFDRDLFPEGYAVSCVKVSLEWILAPANPA